MNYEPYEALDVVETEQPNQTSLSGINFGNILKFVAILGFGLVLLLVLRIGPSANIEAGQEAIDFGSKSTRGTSQWMQVGQFAALVLALFIDTAQKRWRIQEDKNRGSMANIKFRLVQIWFAPLFTALGVMFLITFQAGLVQKILLEPKQTSALVFALISFVLAFFVSEGDISFPAIGFGIAAMINLFQTQKTGVLLSIFNITPDAKMYSFNGIYSLVSQSMGDQARFSLLIYAMLVVAIGLISVDILIAKQAKENSAFDFLIALAIGAVVLFSGTYFTPATGVIVVLLGALTMSIFDLEEFDEVLALGMLLGTFLSIAFTI